MPTLDYIIPYINLCTFPSAFFCLTLTCLEGYEANLTQDLFNGLHLLDIAAQQSQVGAVNVKNGAKTGNLNGEPGKPLSSAPVPVSLDIEGTSDHAPVTTTLDVEGTSDNAPLTKNLGIEATSDHAETVYEAPNKSRTYPNNNEASVTAKPASSDGDTIFLVMILLLFYIGSLILGGFCVLQMEIVKKILGISVTSSDESHKFEENSPTHFMNQTELKGVGDFAHAVTPNTIGAVGVIPLQSECMGGKMGCKCSLCFAREGLWNEKHHV